MSLALGAASFVVVEMSIKELTPSPNSFDSKGSSFCKTAIFFLIKHFNFLS
ncbi:hypothetical protein [Candidatus Nitrosocosmicus sp. R]